MFKHCNIPRDVVRILGTICVIGLIGSLVAMAFGHSVPNELWVLIGTTSGNLGSMLSSTRNVPQDEATKVKVVDSETDPVHVDAN